jgi:hypothetical protein
MYNGSGQSSGYVNGSVAPADMTGATSSGLIDSANAMADNAISEVRKCVAELSAIADRLLGSDEISGMVANKLQAPPAPLGRGNHLIVHLKDLGQEIDILRDQIQRIARL